MEKERNTQQKMILKHLQEHGEISSFEAFEMFGCTRLSAQIYALKHKGYHIGKEMVSKKNRFGGTCTFANYKYLAEVGE